MPIGLAALPSRAPRRRHQPRRDPDHPLAAADQEPLQRRPRHAGNPQAPTPARRSGRAPRTPTRRSRERRPRPSSRPAAGPSPHRPPRSCASSCACPHRARSSPRPLSPRLKADTRRTRLAGGGATLLSSHAGHPRPATSDTTKGSQATPADSLKESQLAARSGPSPRRRTSPTPESKQQASNRKCPVARCRALGVGSAHVLISGGRDGLLGWQTDGPFLAGCATSARVAVSDARRRRGSG